VLGGFAGALAFVGGRHTVWHLSQARERLGESRVPRGSCRAGSLAVPLEIHLAQPGEVLSVGLRPGSVSGGHQPSVHIGPSTAETPEFQSVANRPERPGEELGDPAHNTEF
jgi:hypothetical protein